MGAAIIDYVIHGFVFITLFGIAAALDGAGAPMAVFVPFSSGALLAVWLVPSITMALTNGQTVGKRAIGIRVIRTNGARVGFWWSLLREWPVKALLSLLIVLDQLWPLWDRENRAIHDMVVGSRVVASSDPPHLS